MKALFGLAAISVTSLALGGCVHTLPELSPEFGPKAQPTINTIVQHIACEVQQSDAVKADVLHPADKRFSDYLVTVLLTLQVDDTIDVTPSLGLTQNLKKPAVSLVTTVNADLGGARQRTYTTTYSFNVADLKQLGCAPIKQAAYSLTGDLKINEIINEGLDVADNTDHPYVIHKPANTNDKSGPSFGSKVQFIITQSITNAGPVWTLKYFKGVGGNSGLFAGKRVDTDSVLITFAPKPPPAAVAPDNNKALEDALKALTAAIDRKTADLNSRKVELASIQHRSGLLSAQVQIPGLGPKSKQALSAEISGLKADEARQEAAVKSAEDDLANTKLVADVAASTKQSLDVAAQANVNTGQSAAASASQQLQLNMLLQNLNLQH